MDKIKYRIWDTEEQVYFLPTYKAYQNKVKELYLLPNGDLCLRTMYNVIHESLFPYRFIKELYIGLTDIDGVEMYEGDIVEYENGNAGYGRPRYQEISRDVIKSITNHDDFVDNISWWVLGKVIGNIHEHPELLEESRCGR